MPGHDESDYPQPGTGWGPPAGGEPQQPAPGWPSGPPAGTSPPGPADGPAPGWGGPGGSGYPPPGYPPPGYTHPWPSPWHGDRPIGEVPGKGMALASLVIGIISLPAILTVVGGVVLGAVAIGLGVAAVRRSNRRGTPGRGLAVAGIVTGSAGLLLGGLVLAFAVVALSDSHFMSCLRHSAGSSGALRHCEAELRRRLGVG